MVEAEEAYAVGHLFADSVKACEILHGILIVQGCQMGKVQPA